MKKFNINSDMYIQITEKGWEHLKKTVGDDYIKHCIDNHKLEINDEIWYKLQCYDVFSLLPARMGMPVLFKTNVMFDEKEITDFN